MIQLSSNFEGRAIRMMVRNAPPLLKGGAKCFKRGALDPREVPILGGAPKRCLF